LALRLDSWPIGVWYSTFRKHSTSIDYQAEIHGPKRRKRSRRDQAVRRSKLGAVVGN